MALLHGAFRNSDSLHCSIEPSVIVIVHKPRMVLVEKQMLQGDLHVIYSSPARSSID
jgi:hypothetical protein